MSTGEIVPIHLASWLRKRSIVEISDDRTRTLRLFEDGDQAKTKYWLPVQQDEHPFGLDTVYVQSFSWLEGRWLELGYYNGGDIGANLVFTNTVLAHVFEQGEIAGRRARALHHDLSDAAYARTVYSAGYRKGYGLSEAVDEKPWEEQRG